MKKPVVLSAMLIGALACQDATSPPPNAVPTPGVNAAVSGATADDYIVTLRADETDPDGRARGLVNAHGGALKHVYRRALKGFAVANLPPAAAEALSRHPLVASIERDGIVSIDGSGTQTGATWGIDRIDQRDRPLDQTYAYDGDGTGVPVYIIDTGIRTSHNEFGGRASSGFTAINDGNGTNDCNGHGTHVAGTVGGSTYGVAQNANLIAVRVLGCGGSGSTSGVIAGIDWVTSHHAPGANAVANMSLGGGFSSALNTAVENSIKDGVTYAVAAGNSNANACNSSPASAPSALTVASTTSSDAKSSFSNHGTCVDINAPGSSITSARYTSNTAAAVLSGTSMAAPHVAGAAAVYLSLNPGSSPGQVEAALEGSATTGRVTGLGNDTPNLLLYTHFTPVEDPGDPDDADPAPAPSAAFTKSCSGFSCTLTDRSTGAAPGSQRWVFSNGDEVIGVASVNRNYAPRGGEGFELTVTGANGVTAKVTGSVTCNPKKCQ